MLRTCLRVFAIAALFATAAHANEVCQVKLSLAGGTFDTSCTNACAIAFSNPQNVVYVTQWSYLTITNQSADLDRVEVQVDLMWSSIGKLGTNLVWVAGWPPQNVATSGGNDTAFANGSGNFGGISEPVGSQISLDSNGAIAPSGLAYITYSQPGGLPKNVRWSAMSTGEGRIRMSFWYLTDHNDLTNWLAVQSSGHLICGL